MDENGTLDLSMKKNRSQDKVMPLTSSSTALPTPSSSPFKTSSILVNAAFYQALCEQEGWDTPINYSKTHGRKEEEKEVVFHFLSDFFPWMSGRLMVFGTTSPMQFKGNQFPQVEVCECWTGFNALSDAA